MISAVRCQATSECHSVRSCQLPSLSLKRSLVASVNLATGVPLGVYLTSGSLPRCPTRMTLFTLFDIGVRSLMLKWGVYQFEAGFGRGKRDCDVEKFN